MTIADRIQNLRKGKGISQEELADKIGVSRQTISKWESEQSVPDMDKVVLMSDYFGVTTDYLLKGIETPEEEDRRIDARILSLTGLIVCFIGLFVSIAVWIEIQTAAAVVIAMITDVVGIAVFFTGQYTGRNKEKAKKLFWLAGIWPIVLVPYSCLFNLLQGLMFGYLGTPMPYPEIVGNSIAAGIIGWIVYFAICIVFDCVWLAKTKSKEKAEVNRMKT